MPYPEAYVSKFAKSAYDGRCPLDSGLLGPRDLAAGRDGGLGYSFAGESDCCELVGEGSQATLHGRDMSLGARETWKD